MVDVSACCVCSDLQGPSGSGNLSQCVHSKKSAGGSAFDPYTETGPVPSDHSQYMVRPLCYDAFTHFVI